MGVDVPPYMQQGGSERGGRDTRLTLTALPTPNPQHQRLDHAALQWNNPLIDYHALDTIKIHIASYLFLSILLISLFFFHYNWVQSIFVVNDWVTQRFQYKKHHIILPNAQLTRNGRSSCGRW